MHVDFARDSKAVGCTRSRDHPTLAPASKKQTAGTSMEIRRGSDAAHVLRRYGIYCWTDALRSAEEACSSAAHTTRWTGGHAQGCILIGVDDTRMAAGRGGNELKCVALWTVDACVDPARALKPSAEGLFRRDRLAHRAHHGLRHHCAGFFASLLTTDEAWGSWHNSPSFCRIPMRSAFSLSRFGEPS